MELEEIIEADVSACISYIKFLSPLPLEATLIQNFTMSFQIGDNSKVLDSAIVRMLLRKDKYTKEDIFSVVNRGRYYKCIYRINNIVELAILKELKNYDILGVKFISLYNVEKKLMAKFSVLR